VEIIAAEQTGRKSFLMELDPPYCDVIVQRLKQEVPGQLGKIARRMAEAGVNIEVQYSDHINHLILVVDDIAKARVVSEKWLKDPG